MKCLALLEAHDLVRKPDPTFRDHAREAAFPVREQKLGCRCIAGTISFIRPRERGGGGPCVAERSMVEGAQAVRNILWRQEKLRCKRPAHRTSCGPPSPLSRGGMQNAVYFHFLVEGLVTLSP
jgi:hypothetical protein